MSLLSENFDIKIRDVGRMHLGPLPTRVAPRPYHCLALRLRGGVEFDFGDKKIRSESGEVFFMPARIGYKAEYDGKNEIIFIHFESASDLPPENFKVTDTERMNALFSKVYEVFAKKDAGYCFDAVSLLAKILALLSKETSPVPNESAVRSFEEAVAYMNENYTNSDFSVDDLVHRSHMSNTYFRKLFLSKYGKTPVKYILSMRLSYAEKLLSHGRYSVLEVAEMSGFSDVKYFSRVMKREYGVPPSELYKHIKP